MDQRTIEIARAIKAWWDARTNPDGGTPRELELVRQAKGVLGDWDNCASCMRDELDEFDIAVLARAAGAQLQPAWLTNLLGPLPEAVPTSISVYFEQEAPDQWEWLASRPLRQGLSVSLSGTRISSGNGAIDGTLKPCYAQRLQRVNDARVKRGIPPLHI